MENLTVKASYDSPEISFDAGKGILELRGNSMAENPLNLYDPIIEWIESYFQKPCNETTVNFKIFYFNSSSKRHMLKVLERMPFTDLMHLKRQLKN